MTDRAKTSCHFNEYKLETTPRCSFQVAHAIVMFLVERENWVVLGSPLEQCLKADNQRDGHGGRGYTLTLAIRLLT